MRRRALLSVATRSCCSRVRAPRTAGSAAAAAPRAAPPIADGSPQIADSADGVHIEYQVYGRGEPAVILIHGWANNAQLLERAARCR